MRRKILHIILLMTAMAGMGTMAVHASDEARPDTQVELTVPEASVRPGSHCIVVELATDTPRVATVIALTGQIVKQVEVVPGTNRVDINPGYYIVRINNISQRVVVR